MTLLVHALFDQICGLDEYYLTRTELAILESTQPEWPTRWEGCEPSNSVVAAD